MIPVNEPVVSKEAKENVLDCLKTGWISSAGSYIQQFEESFSDYIGKKYGITTSNGTTALHLALTVLGIGPGDEVILPDLTIISCPFAVTYTGATPVVVDVDPITGTLDPALLSQAITPRTKAIMVVHLYGHPADMDPIMKIARKHNLFVIEDAAEAHGAEYKGKKAGSIGDLSCFSFYANKLISTGEGGMVLTDNQEFYEKAKVIKDLAHSKQQRFVHEVIGYNYRLTNLQAALGCGELSHVDEYLEKKRWMAKEYNQRLRNIRELILPVELDWAKSSYWMYAVRVSENSSIDKQTLRQRLKDVGVDTRDYFYPIHQQPFYTKQSMFKNISCPVSEELSISGLYLPSGLAITIDQIEQVSAALQSIFTR